MQPSDPYDLERFVAAQERSYAVALGELRRGSKATHWMWYIFPQLAGLGTSSMAQKYALASLAEARAFLAHPILGPRIRECCQALLSVRGKSAAEVMGYPDDLKLRSSMTLFALAEGERCVFDEVIERYFEGRRDGRTIALLERGAGDSGC